MLKSVLLSFRGQTHFERAVTAILYWTHRAELTNDPSLGVNQKMNDSKEACCGAEALGLRLDMTMKRNSKSLAETEVMIGSS